MISDTGSEEMIVDEEPSSAFECGLLETDLSIVAQIHPH